MRNAALFTLLSAATGALGAMRARRSSNSYLCFTCPPIGTYQPEIFAQTGGNFGCLYTTSVLDDNGDGDYEQFICSFTQAYGTEVLGWNDVCDTNPAAPPTNYSCADDSNANDDGTAEWSDGDGVLHCSFGYGALACAYSVDTGVQDQKNDATCPDALLCPNRFDRRKRAAPAPALKSRAGTSNAPAPAPAFFPRQFMKRGRP